MKKIETYFYQNNSGREPVREFLQEFSKEDKRIIGGDIKTIEYGWPIGMAVCKPLGNGLYEVRSTISSKREIRIIFYIRSNQMILLHGFIKKSQKTPDKELELSKKRKKEVM